MAELVPCPYCTAQVGSKRLDKHISSVHANLVNLSEAEKLEAAARATEERNRPKPPENWIGKRNRVMCSAGVNALPLMVRRNHVDRQRLYLDAYETGIVGTEIESLPVCFCQCYLCGKWGTRSLYRVPLKDGTCIDLAQDCFDALLGINEDNIAALRDIVGLYSPSADVEPFSWPPIQLKTKD